MKCLYPRLIERTRLLPYHGQVDVQEGEWVTERQSVAHLDYVPANMHRISVAKDLVIDPYELSQVMLKAEGDFVRAGEALASSYLFGERITSVSLIDGYLGLVSRRLGNVYLRQPIPLASSELVQLDVPKELAVSELQGVLRVRVGTRVFPGQPLAATVGLNQKVLVSPVFGKVTAIEQGCIMIVPLQVQTRLPAYLQGRVAKVIPGRGVSVRAVATVLAGQYGVGGEQGGQLLIMAEPNQTLAASEANEGWRGKVVVAGQTADLALLQAAAQVGCAALVIGHLSFSTLTAFLGKAGTPGLTGNEEIEMTVISTERFRPASMRAETWNALRSLEGRYASVNGTTQIRAGVARPEIVVCEAVWPEQLPAVDPMVSSLHVNDWVRLLRNPWRDHVGRIVALPSERERLATGSEVQVAVVAVDCCQVIVPVANLSKCEEEVG